jgi:hypothetical protein
VALGRGNFSRRDQVRLGSVAQFSSVRARIGHSANHATATGEPLGRSDEKQALTDDFSASSGTFAADTRESLRGCLRGSNPRSMPSPSGRFRLMNGAALPIDVSMGFLSRLTSAYRSEGAFTVTAEPLAAGALLSVVGESFYKPALDRTAAIAVPGTPPLPVGVWVANSVAKREPDLPWFLAVLVREPDNPYDSNAIAVYSPAGKIGHLSREDAEEYQDVLIAVEQGGAQGGACSAFLRGAGMDNWGVVLALSSPDICLEEVAA